MNFLGIPSEISEGFPRKDEFPRTGHDRVLWRHDHEVFKPAFSAAQTWNYLRNEKSKVPWHCLVWFPQAIPRQSFMVWLTFKERLSTGVRMRDWGIE
ncbi:hypothetical protein DY000_02012748 [Brassica cretica]|uniref:Reverse transcriptase zinc-binding domain-containing protein n=1 Tax=Brassica cretica TaxID=69181 RepID=A0ABQ7D3N8_BRACR|nr:hypothetical protein DY000_02012748 [Brassica cretica]